LSITAVEHSEHWRPAAGIPSTYETCRPTPARAVRDFYTLGLPRGELGITLLIAELAAAAVVG
jgi:hypothetical protein